MSSKACFKCGVWKDLSEYYVHKQMGDGHLNKCKDCTKKDTKNRNDVLSQDPKWKEKERTRGREKHHRLYKNTEIEIDENYRAIRLSKEALLINKRNSLRKYRSMFPEKYKAHTAARDIISVNGHNHHWSYNEEHWKDVIDLSIGSHNKAHRFIVYDQERMMYRRFDTNELLDTREAHEAFIFDCINNRTD